MKNPAGKPMPTTLHDRSQFTEKNPSWSEAERCLLPLDWWIFFCFCPVLLDTLAGLCVVTQGTPLKTTECQRGRVFISLARATILVTTQARHSQGTVNLDLGCQALGMDVEKSSHTFFTGTGQSISVHSQSITGNAGTALRHPWWGKGLHLARCSQWHQTGCALKQHAISHPSLAETYTCI